MNTDKVLVIERAKWLRGDKGGSVLLDADGHMCCLGFDAVARGLKPEQLLDVSAPGSVEDAPDSYIQVMLGEYACQRLCVIDALLHNDDSSLDEADRENLIAEDLKQLGWDRVEFV